MAQREQDKPATQGASLASKNGGTPSRDAVTTEDGRMNEDVSGAEGANDQAKEPNKAPGGGKASAHQGHGGPRQSGSRSGMTGGQLGTTPTPEPVDPNDPGPSKADSAHDSSCEPGGSKDAGTNKGEGTAQNLAQAGEGSKKDDRTSQA